MIRSVITVVFLLCVVSCSTTETKSSPDYVAEIERWHQLRIDSLKGVTGYLNLAGLYWLENDVNTLGSDSTNAIIFPNKAEPNLGQIMMRNDSLWFIQNDNQSVHLSDLRR